MDLKQLLKRIFGYDSFRYGQEEIIKSILSENDTLVLMPTGGGKSLCYQLPAIVSEGCAIIVSPLIALMKDQVDALIKMNINVALINSSLKPDEINAILYDAIEGKYKMLYIAPERLENKKFINFLKNIEISFLAIDEAHCISQWGHDFRPSYMNIINIFDAIGRKPIMALTATATTFVVSDIKKSLGINEANIFSKGFDRPNLSYIVKEYETTEEKNTHLVNLVSEEKSGSIIVYCASRKKVEKAVEIVNIAGIKAEYYHAGLSPILRKNIQERFISGQLKIIVATNAFGMGIDKADVRKVIHYDMPLSVEAYYQEVGRAGRDGKPSDCVLLYSNRDISLQLFFCEAGYPDFNTIKEVCNALFRITNTDNEITDTNPILTLSKMISLSYYSIDSVINEFLIRGVLKKIDLRKGIHIQLIQSKERIREYWKNINRQAKEVLTALMRNIPQNAYDEYFSFDINKINREYGFGYETIKKYIREFYLNGILEYDINEFNSYKYEYYYDFLSDTIIDEIAKKNMELRKNSYAKFIQVLDYAETTQCKRNYILNYFGDKSYDSHCGSCSTCNSSKEILREKFDLYKLEHTIIDMVNDYEDELLWKDIVLILTGSTNEIILQLRINMTRYFGILGKRSKFISNKAITNLFRKKIITSLDRFEEAIYLTQFGKNYLIK